MPEVLTETEPCEHLQRCYHGHEWHYLYYRRTVGSLDWQCRECRRQWCQRYYDTHGRKKPRIVG